MRIAAAILTALVVVASWLAYEKSSENIQLKREALLHRTHQPTVLISKAPNGDVYVKVDGRVYYFKNACGLIKA